MKEDWIYKRGDLYYANLNPYFGSEQGGTRPVLVLQNNVGNAKTKSKDQYVCTRDGQNAWAW